MKSFAMQRWMVFMGLTVLAPSWAGNLQAGEGTLRWRSFDEGIAEATSTNKKVLIDVFTTWCGWCKRMDMQTYTDKAVVDYLEKRYVVVKIDAESERTLSYKGSRYTERELAAAFGIDGYPSTLFLRSDGEPITIYPGFADPQHFIDVLAFIAEDHYLTTTFEQYISGKR